MKRAEDGSGMCLRNVSCLSSDQTALYTIKQNLPVLSSISKINDDKLVLRMQGSEFCVPELIMVATHTTDKSRKWDAADQLSCLSATARGIHSVYLL
jgi:hypothetical protein